MRSAPSVPYPVPLLAVVLVAGVPLGVAVPRAQAAQEEPPSTPPPGWEATAIDYSNVPYPHPVSYLNVRLMGQDHRMAYMDVAPVGEANGRTVVLFHGMNFFAAAFAPTIQALTGAGFRVIAVDRLGYGRSSKPLIHYNLHIPARNTKALLDELGIERVAVVGHSMGGMVATRFTSTYPEVVTHVAMVNQIGLSDTRPGRPWSDPEDAYRSVLERTSYRSVLAGHRRYYPNGWRDEYMPWVMYQYGLTLGGDWPRMARVRASQQRILFEDPVVHEWQNIEVKALVIGGGGRPVDARLRGPGAQRGRDVAQRGTGPLSGGRPQPPLRDSRALSRGAYPVSAVGSGRAGGSGVALTSVQQPPS